MVVKNRYVPVDVPRPICWAIGVDASFKESPYLDTADLLDVLTDDDTEILAKTAMDDVLTLDVAFTNLVGEVERIELRCTTELEEVLAERQNILESIDELNNAEP